MGSLSTIDSITESILNTSKLTNASTEMTKTTTLDEEPDQVSNKMSPVTQYYSPSTVKCRKMSHPLCPLMSADIAGHPVTSHTLGGS
jgi:hypothetical protein